MKLQEERGGCRVARVKGWVDRGTMRPPGSYEEGDYKTSKG